MSDSNLSNDSYVKDNKTKLEEILRIEDYIVDILRVNEKDEEKNTTNFLLTSNSTIENPTNDSDFLQQKSEESNLYLEEYILKKLLKIDGFENIYSHGITRVREAIKCLRNFNIKIQSKCKIDSLKLYGEFVDLIKEENIKDGLLDRLYNQETQKVSLQAIRCLFDIKNSNVKLEYEGTQRKLFFDYLFYSIYHSKKLLNVTISPCIAKIFFGNEKEIINYKFEKERENKLHKFKFTWNEKDYEIEVTKKRKGIQFGGLFSIKNSNDNKIIKKYFVKACFGYPRSESKEKSLVYSYLLWTPMLYGYNSNRMHKSRLLDLKEPFVYKVLEYLGIGPKTHFIINPYISNGFFIATEDLNEENVIFQELKTLEDKKQNYFFDESTFTDYIYDYDYLITYRKNNDILFEKKYPMIVSLAEIELLGIIFYLNDITNGTNIGYTVPEDNLENSREKEDLEKEWYRDNRFFKIIDFLVGKGTSYKRIQNIKEKIVESKNFETEEEKKEFISEKNLIYYYFLHFLKGNVYTYYKYHNMQSLFLTKCDRDLKAITKKIFFSKQAMDNINERILNFKKLGINANNQKESNELDSLLRNLLESEIENIKNLMVQRNELNNRTNAELLGFSLGKKIEIQNNEQEVRYLEEEIKDLYIYCDGIMENYKILKALLNEKYKKSFVN